jgi:hypothetical protein
MPLHEVTPRATFEILLKGGCLGLFLKVDRYIDLPRTMLDHEFRSSRVVVCETFFDVVA